MYNREDYQDIADELIANDRDRDVKFEKIDKMHNVEWDMPKEWKNTDWIRKYPSTKPADALDTAIRALSTKEPRLNIMPVSPNQATRDSFDVIERGFMWAWRQIGRRSQFSPTRAIVSSAIKYDEITAQLIHLPTHNKALKKIGGTVKNSYGNFALVVHNPRNVHVQYSDDGFERVVLFKREKAHKIIDFWGKAADELKTAIEGDKKSGFTDWVDVYDYWDKDVRYVWVRMVEGGGGTYDLLAPSEHKLGFIPWTCRIGGSSLENSDERQRRPLLNSVVNGDIWNTSNLFRSLMLSLTMARAAEPTIKSITPTGDGVDINAVDAIGQFQLRQGEEMQKLPPSEIGQSIQGMYQMLGGEMETSAGINLLQMNSAPSGMAFATYNAMMQAAMASINPHKQLAELAIADIFCVMAEWMRYAQDSMVTYDDRKDFMRNGQNNYGNLEVVNYNMLPERQDFNPVVKLTEYVPSDELGKINAMTMLVQNLNYPVARALEAIDVNDPKTMLEEWAEEQRTRALVMEDVKDIQFTYDTMRQQQQMKLLQAQQAQVQQQMQPPQGSESVPNPQGAAFDNTQGIGYAPNFGGQQAIGAAPDMTGVGLPQIEGVDYRGLGIPPEGRKVEV